jgi:hypothetical protein
MDTGMPQVTTPITVTTMIDHWTTVTNFRETCYCGAKIRGKEWESVWHGIKHYKHHKCSCGKELWMTVDFDGSGHDSWDGTHSWIQDMLPKKKQP